MPLRSSPMRLAYVMFTSGSTGRPKGVMIPHRGFARLVYGPGCIDISERDVFLLSAPLSFDASDARDLGRAAQRRQLGHAVAWHAHDS